MHKLLYSKWDHHRAYSFASGPPQIEGPTQDECNEPLFEETGSLENDIITFAQQTFKKICF